MAVFLKEKGGYRELKAYQQSQVVYDLTYTFTIRFLNRGDRTIDQMVQAARSGKQNIAEGSKAAMTSRETEIKLTNVARASLEELLIDFEDYMRLHQLPRWGKDHPRHVRMKEYLRSENFFLGYTQLLPRLNAEEMCNLGCTLIYQTRFLLERLLAKQQEQFLQEGGIREQMTRARLEYRNRCQGK